MLYTRPNRPNGATRSSRIARNTKGVPGPAGPTGLTGVTGPTGSLENSATCTCVNQMRNIIQQIITLYPTDNLSISMESGNNVSGRASSLLPGPDSNPDSGLFQLENSQGVMQEAVSICRIAAITITSSTYNDDITFLPVPSPLPTGCDANCENALRKYLPVGTTGVNLQAGSRTIATGDILKSEYGMVVVVGSNNSNPTFASLCKVEIASID